MISADHLRQQILAAKKRGFVPGDCYWRGATLMVEVAPGNFINEATAKAAGVVPKSGNAAIEAELAAQLDEGAR